MEHQSPLRWTNIPSDGSLTNFAKRYQLDPRKLVLEKGLLILPRNVELQTGTTNIDVFPSTTKELLATFNDRELEAELYGQGNIRRELIRKSADILLPVLFFAGSAAAAVQSWPSYPDSLRLADGARGLIVARWASWLTRSCSRRAGQWQRTASEQRRRLVVVSPPPLAVALGRGAG